jgi:retron-type reverse transcriptase
VADTINKALENRQFCTATFLDVSQAFDKVWHPRLLYKIKKKILPTRYFNLLKSYLQGRHFVTKYNNETSRSFQIHSGVPQGSILGPLLYILYTSDLPTSRNTSTTSRNWLKKCKIKVDETKSSHITFTLRKDNCPAISINQTVSPQVGSVKYLGLHFDCKLN